MIGIVIKPSNPISVFNSPVFCNFCQITGLLTLVYLASFYKTQETFLYICFIIFGPLYISPILFYQFVNLLGRFGEHIFHSNLVLNQINKVGFASYLAFYAMHLGPGNCLVEECQVLDPDGFRVVCYHYTIGLQQSTFKSYIQIFIDSMMFV